MDDKYLANALPDTQLRKKVLYWFIALWVTLAEKGPELSTDLRQLRVSTHPVVCCGVILPPQLCMDQLGIANTALTLPCCSSAKLK